MNKPQLFLLHFAGGNSFSFQFMKPWLPEFEFLSLELPGRGRRSREPLIRNFEAAAADIHRQIKRLLQPSRFLIYGHSMGATLALKVAGLLEKERQWPMQVIVTGNPGPGVKENKKRHLMEKQVFRDELKEIGGIPEEVLESEEMLEFFEPILRADFEVIEKEEEMVLAPIKAPIYAMMGSGEDQVEAIGDWKNFTQSGFASTILEGNHFFIYRHAAQIAEIIRTCYRNSIASAL
jgi:surfactin synthase thioesterase subunit